MTYCNEIMIKCYDSHLETIWYHHDSYSDSIIAEGGTINLRWHNIGHPAHIDKTNNKIAFWVNNVYYRTVKEYCEGCGFDGETTMFWLLKYGEKLPEHLDQL